MKKTFHAFLAAFLAASLLFAFAASAGVLGDFDSDNSVTSDDAVYLLRHTLFQTVYPLDSYADFDNDGSITSDDAVYLLRFTLFPNYYTLSDGKTKSSEGLSFGLNSSGTGYIVTGIGNCLDKQIVIPNKHQDLPVIEIGVDAFSQANIESVVIADGITTIKDGAFWKCSSLTSVTLPASLHTIGEDAFKACDNLFSVVFSAADGWDKYSAGFLSNTNIAAQMIKSDLGEWTHHQWNDPVTLNKLTCENNGYYRHTCKDCGIEETYYVYAAGHDFNKNDICKKCNKKYTPTNDSYFVFCRLDDGTYSIKANNDVYLPNYTVFPKTHNGKPVTAIEDEGFKGYPNRVFNSTSFSSKDMSIMTLPNSITSIGGYSFYYTNLTSVTIPDSVTSIGWGAFGHCENLVNVIIGNNVTSIGDFAFEDCKNLISVTIGSGVVDIGSWAFSYCPKLVEINYLGTKAQWENIKKSSIWIDTNSIGNTPSYVVHCTDGDIVK